MTTTNRFLNRLFILLVGLVLLAAGGAVAAGVLLPGVQEDVSAGAEDAAGPASDALSGSQPWILWVAAAGALVLVVLLLWFVLRQGRGRTSTLLRIDAAAGPTVPTGGSLTVDAAVARQILEEDLARDPSIVSVDVTAFRLRRQSVLRVTAHSRRGASPIEIRRSIDASVRRWDALLGQETPIVIQIVGGLRTRVNGTTRVL